MLKALDNYNANDLSTASANSSGDIAGLCINLALHKIYDLIRDTKYLKAHPSTSLSSVADQDYIDLDVEPYLDEIENLSDATNNITLRRKSWAWYRRNVPNPENESGIPEIYIRRGTRIYLTPRPTSVINYTCDLVKNTNDLVNDGDISLLPTKFDYWIIAEAKVEWYAMEDAQAIPQSEKDERDDKRAIALDSIHSGFDTYTQSGRHF